MVEIMVESSQAFSPQISNSHYRVCILPINHCKSLWREF